MKLQKPVKGIFFDLGWTLIYPAGSWLFSDFARRYFPTQKLEALPKERVDTAMAKAMDYLNNNHLVLSIDREYDQFIRYYSMLARALPELGLTGEVIQMVARDKVYNTENYKLYPDVVSTLESLCEKYKLGIISDTWPSIEPVLEVLGLRKFFSCTTYSFNLGIYKPHPKMYSDAIKKMGLPPEETIFIDDSVENLLAAEKMGVTPVLIQAKPDFDTSGDMACIKKISELLDILP